MSGTEKIAMNQCICGAIADGRAFTIVCAIASTMPESLMTPMKIPTANRVTVITIAFDLLLFHLLLKLSLSFFSRAILFLNGCNHERNRKGNDDKTNDSRNDKAVEISYLNADNTCGTHGRSTPRDDIHNTVRSAHCSEKCLRADSHLLTDRKECRNNDQEGCRAGTV